MRPRPLDARAVADEVAALEARTRRTLVVQRQARMLTQKAVAELTFPCLTYDNIKKLETGGKRLTMEVLVVLARVYETTPANIIQGHVVFNVPSEARGQAAENVGSVRTSG